MIIMKNASGKIIGIVTLLALIISLMGAAVPALAFSTAPMVAAGAYHSVGLKSNGTVVAKGDNYYNQCDVVGWSTIIQVAAGANHTVGLKSDGRVVAVGDNGAGQRNVTSWTAIVKVAAGDYHTVGLRLDGMVVAVGYNDDNACGVGGWSDIVQVSAGANHTVGLKSDGTVVAVGSNQYGQTEVDGWNDIVQVAAGGYHTVGLKADGTVVAVGYNSEGQCEVGGWTGIFHLVGGGYHTVGLKADGTVVAVGDNWDGQCNVGGWTAIAQVAAGFWHTLGLKMDGTVVAVGDNWDGKCEVGGWSDIIQVAAGYDHTLGLKANGKVTAVGDNWDGQRDVGGWRDIIQVAAGGYHTVGLKADGTVVAVGDNWDGQCNVGGWTAIAQVAAGAYHTVGLKADGRVVAVGDKGYGRCNVNGWRDIIQVAAGAYHTVGLKADGTAVAVGDNGYGQCNVSGWSDIVQVSAGANHTVGLKSDGTVVAVGDNSEGQCNVSGWTDIIQVAAGAYHTVGLKADGTAVAVGDNWDGKCEVGGWSDIIQVAAGYDHTLGLKADGTVVGVGNNREGQLDFDPWYLGTAYGPHPGTNLVLSMHAPANQSRGKQITYRLFYNNTGADPARNVQLTCTLPNQVTVESYSSDGQQSGNQITWALGTIDSLAGASKSVTVQIKANVPVNTRLTCNASITTSTTETRPQDNAASVGTRVVEYTLPEGVDISGVNNVFGQTPSVNYEEQIVFRYSSCSSATAVDVRIRINDGGPDIIGTMSGGPPQWEYAVIFYPRSGSATVTYTIQGCTVTEIDFSLYIDPAGIVYDVLTGDRIAGAVVTLQRSDGLGGWVDVPINIFPVMLPNVNPQITGADGWYQWDTLAGSYRVRVQAEGYYPAYSPMVTVPPPVFDLHVGLTPLPAGVEIWYLDSVEELQKRGVQSGTVGFYSGDYIVWFSDEPAAGGFTFPSGIWKVHLLTQDWNGECLVQIGEWDGLNFIPFHVDPVHGILNDNLIEARINTGGTILDGNWLALKITRQNGGEGLASIITNGESYVMSPGGSPGYPIPELSALILLGLGLAGLGVYLVMKKRKTLA